MLRHPLATSPAQAPRQMQQRLSNRIVNRCQRHVSFQPDESVLEYLWLNLLTLCLPQRYLAVPADCSNHRPGSSQPPHGSLIAARSSTVSLLQRLVVQTEVTYKLKEVFGIPIGLDGTPCLGPVLKTSFGEVR